MQTNNQNNKNNFLFFLREYRVVSVLLTIFVLWWGYDAYMFVNMHYSDINDFTLAFYTSIVMLAGWVIKNWMTTTHNSGNSGNSDNNQDYNR